MARSGHGKSGLSKEALVAQISALISIDPPPLSTGSREPRELLASVNEQLGLGMRPTSTKTQFARGIVEAAGRRWLPPHESRGEVITTLGLEEILAAVRDLVAD